MMQKVIGRISACLGIFVFAVLLPLSGAFAAPQAGETAAPAVKPVQKPVAPSPPAVKTPAVPKAAAPAKVAAPPAGKGMVWANPDSKIYHREGSAWYGKTKAGSYMTESEAIEAGYRAAQRGGQGLKTRLQ